MRWCGVLSGGEEREAVVWNGSMMVMDCSDAGIGWALRCRGEVGSMAGGEERRWRCDGWRLPAMTGIWN